MKKYPLLMLFFLGIVHVQGQTSAAMNEARMYMNKKSQKYDPAKALSIYLGEAEKGNGTAMNTVGTFYRLGLVELQNEAEALRWFEKAGNAGVSKGWYNAGVIYKNGLQGGEPLFDKTYECFSKAAQAGSFLGLYGLGYLHYKGLGCNQDYEKAVDYFRQAIAKGSQGSMYMLGLCYRNGYGIPFNEDSAQIWLTKAALKGYKAAADELSTAEAEYKPSMSTARSKEKSQVTLPAIGTAKKLQQAPGISGKYTGYIIRYDWSGKNILSHEAIAVQLDMTGNLVEGTWSEKDVPDAKISGRVTDSNLVFSQSAYARKDHYSPHHPVQFEFRNATLQYLKNDGTTFIFGNIRLFSVERNEPEKPVYVMLEQEKSNISNDSTLVKTDLHPEAVPYPNPFSQGAQISLSLKKSSKISLQLFSTQGTSVWVKDYGTLQAGNHVLKFEPVVPPAAYFLKLDIDGQSFSRIIIKQ